MYKPAVKTAWSALYGEYVTIEETVTDYFGMPMVKARLADGTLLYFRYCELEFF